MRKIRCAIYTRKSSEGGLEQEFNSLHAQREACAAYVASQKHEGWVLLKDAYDDGGLSGGTLERPALTRLLDHVRQGKVDQIIVYKIDRLTRSLADFAKIVDILDAAEASFVSVTQSFNTATSMGRLTLNMLLSFAQFEREVTAERIRDKIAASKRKGLWMGGQVPIGYDPDGRTLKINAGEVGTIRMIFDLYEDKRTVQRVKAELDRQGTRTRVRRLNDGTLKGGDRFTRGHLHQILTNPIYAGRIRHKGQVFGGQHPPIIDPEQFDRIQTILQEGARRPRRKSTRFTSSPLSGKLFDETGDRLTPSHTKTRSGTRLRYYVSHRLIARSGKAGLDGWRLPAKEIEQRVTDLMRTHLSGPNLAVKLVPSAGAEQIGGLAARLAELSHSAPSILFDMIERIDLAPGVISVWIGSAILAEKLDLLADELDTDHLLITHPFQLRKRGVETKIVLSESPTGIDDALVRNIAKAHGWFTRIRNDSTSIAEIAQGEGVSTSRIHQMIGLAFLAPDIVRDVLEGKQPLGFTSDWCMRHTLPSDWQAQRDILRTL